MFSIERLETLRRQTRNGGGGDDQRVDGLLELIQYARPQSVIEVGCDHGVSTETWLLHCKRVVAVDPWPDDVVYERFVERCGGYDNLEVIRGRSPEALNELPTGSFDLCYIDGEHDAISATTDIVAGLPLVRRGGVIAGHDYYTFGGVHMAVNLLLGLPHRVFSDGSWAVRK